MQREVTGGQTDEGLGSEIVPPSPSLLCQEMPLKVHVRKPSKGEFHNFQSDPQMHSTMLLEQECTG